MDVAHILSNNLRALRAARGLSQVAFSQELGIAKSTLQEIEHGHSPTLETISCISTHLGIPISTLVSNQLPDPELGILVHLLQAYPCYTRWSDADQRALLELLRAAVQLIAKYSP